jgi:hypothetical protein
MDIQAKLTEAAELIGGRAWGADKGKPRIYMPSSKDRKVYFEFPDYPTGDLHFPLGGAALRIYIDDCGQHPNWYAGQKKRVIEGLYREALALGAWSEGLPELANEIMDMDIEITADLLDRVSHELINGREAEARAMLVA